MGVIETGEFSEANLAGFRVRGTYVLRENRMTLLLRGAGPYYIDLGVERAGQDLMAGIESCLKSGRQ